MAASVEPHPLPLNSNRAGLARRLAKVPVAALVFLALVLGVWSALLRLGWALPAPLANMAGLHGPLMIGGVLGTVIGLERAVALAALVPGPIRLGASRPWHWAWLAPLSSALAALLLILGTTLPMATTAAQLAALFASAVMVAIYVRLLRIHITGYTVVMGIGALLWLGGNLLWLAGQPFYLIVHWWMGFLVLTVVGERLELSRMTSLSPRRRNLFLIAIGLYCAGILYTLIGFDLAVRLSGLGLLLAALWMMRYDIARRTVQKPGLTRYIALCLLSGYVWLALAGLLAIRFGAVYGGYAYDALIHAVLLGFIFSMIFGHAPIILPALSGLHVQFGLRFYVPLILLHLTLLMRTGGNLAHHLELRQWGGLLNAVTVGLFLAILAYSVLRRPPP